MRQSVDVSSPNHNKNQNPNNILLFPEVSSKHSDVSRRNSLYSDQNFRSINLYQKYKQDALKDSIEITKREESLKPDKQRFIKTSSVQKIENYLQQQKIMAISNRSIQDQERLQSSNLSKQKADQYKKNLLNKKRVLNLNKRSLRMNKKDFMKSKLITSPKKSSKRKTLIPKNKFVNSKRKIQLGGSIVTSTKKKNQIKKKKLTLENYDFKDYYFNSILDILIKYFQQQKNISVSFSYTEEMKLSHFKTMFKKFQALKMLNYQDMSFGEHKTIDIGSLYKPIKKTLVLDLDETLIYCSLKCSNREAIAIQGQNEGQIMYVHKRPYLEMFLEKMSKIFTLIVYSAANDNYVEKVVNVIDPNRKYIKVLIGRSGCLKLNEKTVLKSLQIIKNVQLNKCVIIENNPQSFIHDLDNMIPIVSFYGDVMDDELEKLAVFLEQIQKKRDFRTTIKKCFRIKSFMECESLQEVVNQMLSTSKYHQDMLIYNQFFFNSNLKSKIF